MSAYEYFWDENALPADRNLIRAFFDKCSEMEYTEFIKIVNDEYGALLENYRLEKQVKTIAAIKGILTFFLVMYIIGIVVGIIVLLV